MRSNVDLPEPLRPTKQIRSPAATAKVAPERSGVTPKVRLMSCSRISGGGMAGYGSGCSRRYGRAIACGTEDAASANFRLTRGHGPTRPSASARMRVQACASAGRKMLGRAGRLAAALRGSPAERAKIVRELVEKVRIDEETIVIKVRRGALLGRDAPSGASDKPSDSTIELAAAVDFKRHGVETKLVLPGLAQQNHGSRCNPGILKRKFRPHGSDVVLWR